MDIEIFGIVLGIVLVCGVIWCILVYNSLLGYRENYRTALSEIDVMLNNRYSTLTNIVKTVKGYLKHEHDTLTDVISARSEIFEGKGKTNFSEMQQKFSLVEEGAVRVLNLCETYPELKADERFRKAEELLEKTESRLNTKRSYYNDAVQHFIMERNKFPTILISWLVFPEVPSRFEAPEYAKGEVDMDFT